MKMSTKRELMMGFVFMITSLAIGCSMNVAKPYGATISGSDILQEVIEPELSSGLEVIKSDIDVVEPQIEPESEAEPVSEIIPEDTHIVIRSVGDLLFHSDIYKMAYNSELEVYDFSGIYKNVEDDFNSADLMIANAESVYVPEELGYSGYPRFGTPRENLETLAEIGVDVLTTANNHSLDKGFEGLSSSLDYMDLVGIKHTGTARSQEERDTILYRNVEGIPVAILSYTYGTNGIPKPADKDYCVNLIDKDLIHNDILKAREEGKAELVIVAMHWGVEYQINPTAQQEELAQFLADEGVDIVLGCHPHVLEPMEMIGNTLVIYSMGNFVANQNDYLTHHTAVFEIQIKKDGETGKISLEKATYRPMYIQKNSGNPRVELIDASDEDAEVIRDIIGPDIINENE